jgi:hypothetical protein
VTEAGLVTATKRLPARTTILPVVSSEDSTWIIVPMPATLVENQPLMPQRSSQYASGSLSSKTGTPGPPATS